MFRHSLKRWLDLDRNERGRRQWLARTLAAQPPGQRILDAGAGELANKPLCRHLDYVSQDFCQYSGAGDGQGLQTGAWQTQGIDIVCDITAIPQPDASFDLVLCSEVLEHVPDASLVLREFARLLRPGGRLILTAPFAAMVHFSPYFYVTGFSRSWYLHHLPRHGFDVVELAANGDWFDYCRQEVLRLPAMAKRRGDWCWPLALVVALTGFVYFALRPRGNKADDCGCYGFHCLARRRDEPGV